MAAETVKFNYEVVNGNTLSIIPAADESNNNTVASIQDNSTYTIKIKGLQSADKTKTLPTTQFNVTTAISPAHCTLASLQALVTNLGIPEQDLLTYIRDASKEADFIAGDLSSTNTSSTSSDADTEYAKEQYTRTRAMIDALLRGTISKALDGDNKWTLDLASLEESLDIGSLTDLIDSLRSTLPKWQDAIRGYTNEGRAAPKATRISLKSSSSDVSATTVDQILNDITRSMPERSD